MIIDPTFPDLPISGVAGAIEFFTGEKRGCLQKIDLTFGGAGNQIMTINGVDYATWIDYTEWPKLGSIVKHKPYKRPYRDYVMLCTEIVAVEQADFPK